MSFHNQNHLTFLSSAVHFHYHKLLVVRHIQTPSNPLHHHSLFKASNVDSTSPFTYLTSGLWFGPAEWKECRLGIELLLLLPISEVLFSLCEWTCGVGITSFKMKWCSTGFVYALTILK
jgi:hypothetical protein